MEEKLIIAVSGFPELYDASLFISQDTGLPFASTCWSLQAARCQLSEQAIMKLLLRVLSKCRCLTHLKRDPLVLSGLTEGVSEEEHVINSDSQSQEG